MSSEAEEIPDEPLEPLLDVVDADARPETRDTARANLAVYLREISRIPLLSREEEAALARRVRAGDEAAKARMVESNLRLVVQIARRYATAACPCSTSSRRQPGLLHAVEKFDPYRRHPFSTYATWVSARRWRARSQPGAHHPAALPVRRCSAVRARAAAPHAGARPRAHRRGDGARA